MLIFPAELKCIHCEANHKYLKVKRTESWFDYCWRMCKCKQCGKNTKYGAPHTRVWYDGANHPEYIPDNTRPHLVMHITPKQGTDGKTSNINLSLLAGATIQMLIQNQQLVSRKQAAMLKHLNGRALSSLSLQEKRELAQILEAVQ